MTTMWQIMWGFQNKMNTQLFLNEQYLNYIYNENKFANNKWTVRLRYDIVMGPRKRCIRLRYDTVMGPRKRCYDCYK